MKKNKIRPNVVVNKCSEVESAAFRGLIEDVNLTCYLAWTDEVGVLEQQYAFFEETINQASIIADGLSGKFTEVNFKYLTPELLSSLSWAEPIALDLMLRLDSAKQMTRSQSVRLYHYILAFWCQKIEELKPSIFYSREVPHEVTDFIFYALCKHYGVRTIIFFGPVLLGRRVFIEDFKQPWAQTEDYRNFLADNPAIQYEVDKYIQKIRSDYSKAAPAYFVEGMKVVYGSNRWKQEFLSFYRFVIRRYFKKIALWGIALLNIFPTLLVPPRMMRNLLLKAKKIVGSQLTQDEFDTLPKLLQTLAIDHIPQNPYIFFCLNYQPELTTSPLGGIFNDQTLAISMLSANLPVGWVLVVKEHPGQLIKNDGYNYLGRDIEFYKKLISLGNVEFISQRIDQFDLIDASKCVATITGTAGWEAIIRGKPVVVFGDAWYQSAPNVFRIKTTLDCQQALEKILTEEIVGDDNLLMQFIGSMIASGISIDFNKIEARWANREFNFHESVNIFKDQFLSYIGQGNFK